MRIVLSGYYGFDNAGDEALLTAITRTLRYLNGSVEFTVLSGNPERTARLHGIRAVSRINPFVMIQALRKADLLISGGGSLLQDVTGPLSIPYYLGVVALAKLLGTPVAFYAQGIGPVNGGLGKSLIKLIGNRVDLITLRDEDSAQLLKEIGIHRPPVVVTADPVFSMRPSTDDIARGKAYLESLGLGEERAIIAISVRRWENFNERKLAALADQFYQLGYTVLFLPLQFPDDYAQSQKIMRCMSYPAKVVDRPMTAIEMMGLLSNTRLLVGMRLHSLVFAACAGTRFEGIAYDPKVESFLKLFDLQPLLKGADFDPQQAAQAVHKQMQAASPGQKIEEIADALKQQSDYTAKIVLETFAPAKAGSER